MTVENGVRPGAQRLDHRWAEGHVGHEVSVHHVEVDPVSPGRKNVVDFLAEPGEVGRQDRRRDQHAHASPASVADVPVANTRLARMSDSVMVDSSVALSGPWEASNRRLA